MSTKIRLFILLLFIAALILPTHIALADIGPKPTMEFTFNGVQAGELEIVSGTLYECEQSDCSDASPLKELGPQRLRCDTVSCSATAYGFAPYHILEIEFSDGVTRRSNIFETAGFDSTYAVTVQSTDLLVKPQLSLNNLHPNISILLIGACCLVGFVVVIGLIIFFVRRSKKK